MVIINGTAARRVPKPTIRNMEQITSANTARQSDNVAPVNFRLISGGLTGSG